MNDRKRFFFTAVALFVLTARAAPPDVELLDHWPNVPAAKTDAVQFQRDVGHLAIIEYSGNYDRKLSTGLFNVTPRQAVASEYLAHHPDQFDFLIVFSTFEFDTGDATAFYTGIYNDVTGIGRPLVDNRERFSSQRLQGYIDMAALSRYDLEPQSSGFEGVLGTLLHEIMHQWGIAVRFEDATGTLNSRLLGRAHAHWSYFAHTEASVLYGADWQADASGAFTAVRTRHGYGPLDLYLAGFLTPAEVPTFFYIDGAPGDREDLPPPVGTQIAGVTVPVTIDQIIAAEGPRDPDYATAQKTFRAGFVLLAPPGAEVSETTVAQLQRVARELQVRFGVETLGRGALHVDVPAAGTTEVGQPNAVVGTPVGLSDLSAAASWLVSVQTTQGFWQDKPATRVRDTASAVHALQRLDMGVEARVQGQVWLRSAVPVNHDERAWLLWSGALTAAQQAQLAGTLAAAEHASGGWGFDMGLDSSPWDTALATLALARANKLENTATAQAYLRQAVNDGPAWGVSSGGAGRVVSTALVLQSPLGQGLDPLLRSQSLQWLRGRQGPSGGFGEGAPSAHETARAILALSAHQDGSDVTVLPAAVDALGAMQGTAGDWAGSVYASASAILALRDFQLPNLRLDQASVVPADPISGEPLVLFFSLTNDGVIDTPAVTIAISDGNPDVDGVQLGSVQIGALAGGERLDGSLAVDSAGLGGSRQFYVRLDADAVVAESSEDDNQLIVDIALQAPSAAPDVTLLPASLVFAPQQISQLPSTLDVAIGARNISTQAVPAVDVALVQELSGGTLELARQSVALAAGGTVTVALQGQVEQADALQAFRLVIDPDNVLAERREDDNSVAFAIATGDAVDLTIPLESIQVLSAAPQAGTDVEMRFDLRNLGTVDAPIAQFQARLESPSGILTPLTEFPLQLPAGAVSSRQLRWRPLSAGLYRVHFAIDPDDLVPEGNENNNLAVVAVPVAAVDQANLAVDAASLVFDPNPALAGLGLTIGAIIDNTSAAAAGAFAVAFYDGDPNQDGVPLGRVDVPGLAGESSQTVSLNAPPLPGGERLIYAVVDADRSVVEFDESDNLAFAALRVLRLADLAVAAVGIELSPSTPVPGGPLTTTVLVDNLGEQTVPAVEVALYRIDANGQAEAVGAALTLEPLVGGASATASFAWTFPADGDVARLRAQVDGPNAVVESDESNNQANIDLAQVDHSLFVTESHFSPNGDGVKDVTDIVFDLPQAVAATIEIANNADEILRHFEPPDLSSSGSGSVSWDGRNDRGVLVRDGDYRVRIVDHGGTVIAQTVTTLDTNQLPLLDAIGTPAALFNDLRCSIQSSPSRPKFSADGRHLYTTDVVDLNGVRQRGLLRIATRGEGLSQVVAGSWLQSRALTVSDYWPLADGRVLLELVGAGGSGLYLQSSLQADPVALQLDGLDSSQVLWVGQNSVLFQAFDQNQRVFAAVPLAPGVPPQRLAVPAAAQAFVAPVVGGWLFEGGQEASYHGQTDFMPHLWYVSEDPGQAPVLLGNAPGLDWRVSPDRRYIALSQQERTGFNLAPSQAEVIGARLDQGQVSFYLQRLVDLPALWSFAVEMSPRNELLLMLGHAGLIELYDPAGELSTTIDLPTAALSQALPGLVDDEDPESDLFFGITPFDPWRFEQRHAYPESLVAYAADRRRLLLNFGLAQQQSPGIKAIGPFNFNRAELLVAVDLDLGTSEILASYTRLPGNFPNRLDGSAPRRVTWLPRSDTLLLGPSPIEAIDGLNGQIRALDIGLPNQAWPWRFNAPPRKFFLPDHPAADAFACAGGLSPQLILESADNLIAHLEVKRFAAVLELWGIASDRHPRDYQLDWTYADQPEQWRRLQAPQAGRVIDDFITSWVPPTPGLFRIRLRVQDQAGNRAEHIRELIWAEQANLTDVAVTASHISPNGDGVQDQTSIAFRVLAPLSLNVEIQNSQGSVVRVLSGQYLTAGTDAALVWDGRNQAGQVVADGEYFAHLQGRRLRVVVDTTLPLLSLVAPSAYRSLIDQRLRQAIVSTQFQLELQAVDGQLQVAQLEQRRPGGPWQVLQSWQAEQAEPLRVTVTRDDYVEAEFRLSARDLAGNRAEALIARGTPELILHSIRQFVTDPITRLQRLDDEPLPFQPPPFDPAQFPLLEFAPGDVFHLLVDAVASPPVNTVVLEYADPQQPSAWVPMVKTPLAPEQVIPLLFSGEPAADADSLYRHFLSVAGADFGLLREVLLRARIDLPSGSVHSNGLHLRFLGGAFDVRIGDFRHARRSDLDLDDRLLFDALQAEPLAVGGDASLVWVRQLGLAQVALSRLTVQSPNDTRYPDPTVFLPIAQVDDGQGNFAQLFAIPTDPCHRYRFAWAGTHIVANGQELPLLLGQISEDPALQLALSCIEVEADWDAVVGAFCQPGARNRMQLRALARGTAVPTAMAFYAIAPDGSRTLIQNIVAPLLEQTHTVLVDTTALPEGTAEFLIEVNDSAGGVAQARVLARIDRQAAVAIVDSPVEGQFQCASQAADGSIRLDLVGAITSNDDFFYRAFIASGHDSVDLQAIHPQPPRPACEPTAGVLPAGCLDQSDIVGVLASFDSSLHPPLPAGPVTAVVEAIDASGARMCVFRRFQLDASVDAQVSTVFPAFSPNGDGSRDSTQITITPLERLSLVQVAVYPAAFNGVFGWQRVGPMIGSLSVDATPFAQAAEFSWDGKVDGLGLAHGSYQLEFTLRDDCGLESTRSSFGQLDLIPPQVSLDYPSNGDPLGAIVEVLGSFDDALFEQATVAYFADGGWIDLAQHNAPVSLSTVVARWNLSSLAQAAYPLRIVASDQAGNESTVSETIDYSLPNSLVWNLSAEPSVFSPNGDGSLDQSRIVLGVLADGRFTLVVRNASAALLRTLLNDAALNPGSFDFLWDGRDEGGALLADGDYQLELTATDSGGSGFSQSESVSVRIDTDAPIVNLIYPDAPVVAGSGSAVIELVENGLTLLLSHQVEGAAEQAISARAAPGQQAVLDLRALAEGAHALRGEVLDRAGNRGLFEFLFSIDNTPPELSLDSPKAAAVVGGAEAQLQLQGSVSDDHFDVLELALSPAGAQTWQEIARLEQVGAFDIIWPITVADGDYELRARAIDAAGLESTLVVPLVIDRNPPSALLNAPLPGAVATVGAAILGSATDANLKDYRLSSSPAQAVPPQWSDFGVGDVAVDNGLLWTWHNLPPDGDYRIRLQVADLAGQVSTVESTVRVDATPPEPPSGLNASRLPDGTIGLNWAASPSADTVAYRVLRSGVALTVEALVALTFVDSAVVDGDYRYWVVAVDAGGNLSGPSNVVEITVDRTPPEVVLLSPAEDARVRATVEIIGSATSADDFFEYRLYARLLADAPPGSLLLRSPTAVTGGLLRSWDTRALAQEQAYILRLEGQDASGNVAVVERGVVVDNLAPQTPLGLTAQVLGDNDVQLDWNPNGESDLAGYLLYRDGRVLGSGGEDLLSLAIAATAHVDTAVADGSHGYRIAAIDLAGNLSALSAAVAVAIETGPPTLAFVEPEPGARFEAPLYILTVGEATDIASVAFDFRPAGGTWVALANVTTAPFASTLDAAALGLSFGALELRATAVDNLGQADPAAPTIDVTYADLTAPQAVSGLSLQVNGGQVNLSWNPSDASDLAGYIVERTPADGDALELNPQPIAATAFADLGVADGAYRYRVYAQDQAQNRSDPSATAAALVHSLSVSQPFTPTELGQLEITGVARIPGTVEVHLTDASGSRDLPPVATGAGGTFGIPLSLSNGLNMLSLQLLSDEGHRSKTATVFVQVGQATPAPQSPAVSVTGTQVDFTWQAPASGAVVGYRPVRDALPVLADELLDNAGIAATASSRSSTAGRTLDGAAFGAWSPTDNDLLQAPPPFIEYQFDQARLLLGMTLDWRFFNADVDRPSDYRIEAWSGLVWVPLARVQQADGPHSDAIEFAQPYLSERLRVVILQVPGAVGLDEVRFQHRPLVRTQDYSETRPDGRYRYQVSAISEFGFESALSDAVEVVVGDVLAPDAPVLSATVDGDSVNLSWSASTAADLAEYRVFRNEAPILLRSDLTDLTLVDAALANGRYTYFVVAVDAVGNVSPPSNPVTLDIELALPEPPSALAIAVLPEGGALDLSWQASPSSVVTGYRVQRSLSAGGPYQSVATSVALRYRDTGLVNGITYFYVLSAVDSRGNQSVPSNEASGTPADQIPPLAPSITWPTTAARPIDLPAFVTGVGGTADPSNQVEIFINGAMQAQVRANGSVALQTTAVADQLDQALLSPLTTQVVNLGEPDHVLDLVTAERIDLPSEYARQLAWAPDGAAVYIVEGFGPTRVLRYHLASGITETVLEWDDIHLLAPSPSGQALFVAGRYDDGSGALTGLWWVDLATAAVHPIGAFDDDDIQRESVAWAPDGTSLVFEMAPDFSSLGQLWHYHLASASLSLRSGGLSRSASLAYDGAQVAYTDEQFHLLLLDLAGGGTQTLTTESVQQIAFSDDGTILAYTRGCCELVLYAPTSDSQLVSFAVDPVFDLNWLPSGALLALQFDAYAQVDLPGSFFVDGLLLQPGENRIHAFARDDGGLLSPASATVRVTAPAVGLPDLAFSASDVSVLPGAGMAGDIFRATVVLRNSGDAPAASTVTLTLLPPQGPVRAVLDQAFDLAAGAARVWQVDLTDLVAPGEYQLLAQADPLAQVQELDEGNNQAIATFQIVAALDPTLTLNTSVPEFAPRTDVTGAVTVFNPGQVFSGEIIVTVEDAAGFPLPGQQRFDVVELGFARSLSVPLSWPPGLAFAGDFALRARLFNMSGVLVDEARVAFAIRGFAQFDLSALVDAAGAVVGDAIPLAAELHYVAGNAPQQAVVTWQITDSESQVVFSEQTALPTALPGYQARLQTSWPQAVTSGTYRLRVSIQSEHAQVVSEALFEVAPAPRAPALSAVIGLTSPHGLGANLGVTLHFENPGSTALVAIPVTLSLLPVGAVGAVRATDLSLNLDATTQASETVIWTTGDLALGNYIAVLRANLSGHGGTAETLLDTAAVNLIDGSPPQLLLLTPVDGAIHGADVLVRALAVDRLQRVERVDLRIDGAAPVAMGLSSADGEYRHWLFDLSEGPHDVVLSATDTRGNRVELPAVLFEVDRTPPALRIEGVSAGDRLNCPVAPIVTVSDTHLASFQVRLDGQPFVSGEAIVSEGGHLLSASAIDVAGNRSDAQVAFVLDFTAPLVQIGFPANGAELPGPDTAVQGSTEPLATVSLNAGAYQAQNQADGAGAFSFDAVPLQVGVNSIQLQALDLAGNLGPGATVTVNLVVPSVAGSLTVPATVGLGQPLAVAYSLNNQTGLALTAMPFQVSLFQAGDATALAVVADSVDLAGNASYSDSLNLATGGLGLGVYRVELAADVGSGFELLAAANVSLVDQSAPTVAIVAPASGAITSGQLDLSATAQDAHSVIVAVEFAIDGGGWMPMTLVEPSSGLYSASIGGLSHGLHLLRVRASDAAGNQGLTGERAFEVDAEAPQIDIVGVTDGAIYQQAVMPDFSAFDPHPGPLSATLDGVGFNGGEVVGAEGNHVLTVVAEDALGNQATQSIAFTIDTIAPQLSLSSPLDGQRLSQAVVDVVGQTEANALVSLRLNGFDYAVRADTDGVFALADVPLLPGDNDLSLVAEDLAGNIGQPVTLRVVYDTSALVTGELDVAAGPITVGQSLALSYSIGNLGNAELAEVLARVQVIALASGDVQDQHEQIHSLAVGAEAQVSLQFDTGAYPIGEFRIELTLLPPGAVEALLVDSANVSVAAAEPSLHLRILQPQSGATIVNATTTTVVGETVAEASVRVINRGFEALVTADAAGRFEVAGVPIFPGRNIVRVSAFSDNDGVSREVVVNGPALALWVNSQEGADALKWSGSNSHIVGLVHSNAGIKISGSNKSVTGPLQWVSEFKSTGANNTYTPGPLQVGVQEAPIAFDFTAYQPGGAAAEAAGELYFDHSADCTADGKWQLSGSDNEVPTGLHYVPCEVKFSGARASGYFSIVSSGEIQISGADTQGRPFMDNLLLATSHSGGEAIKLSGSGGRYSGYLYAPAGSVEVSGSGSIFTCGVIADRVKLSGSGHSFDGSGCAGFVLPDIALNTAVDTLLEVPLVPAEIDTTGWFFAIVSAPQLGQLSGEGAVLQYQPQVGASGQDVFQFIANDGETDANVVTVTIQVGGNPGAKLESSHRLLPVHPQLGSVRWPVLSSWHQHIVQTAREF